MAPQDNKILYILIGGIMLLILAGFVVYKNQSKETSTEKGSYSFITSKGKKIEVTLRESSASSSAIISTEGFEVDELLTIEKEKLSDVFFTDLNGDSSEELILIFTPLAAGSNGTITIFTTYYDSELTPVELLEISENDKSPGGLFEGYIGGDSFFVEENTLFRDFLAEETEPSISIAEETEEGLETESSENNISVPTQEAATTTSLSTRQKRIWYTLTSSEGLFFLEPKELGQARVLTASSTATLENTTWKWLSLNRKGVVITSNNKEPLVFSFANNTFIASSSCDYFSGDYTLTGYLMRLGPIITDSTDLDNPCVGENALLKETLPLSKSFVIRDDQLMITLTENKGVILFIKQ